MQNNFKSLEDKFNTKETDIILYKEHELIENDFEQSRLALKNMIKKSQEIVDEMIAIARSSESPKAYETASKLIQSVTGAAKTLLEIQKLQKDIKEPSKTDIPKIENQQNNINNNIVFNGTTEDFIKMLRKAKSQELSDDS